jgi:hypothetical protein
MALCILQGFLALAQMILGIGIMAGAFGCHPGSGFVALVSGAFFLAATGEEATAWVCVIMLWKEHQQGNQETFPDWADDMVPDCCIHCLRRQAGVRA